mmetsp:Transcript_44593/g.105730  ORF Transcript_44593/g.105730 Transcript_44593/m.105730 type:complete len:628 (-) Transcript_44593:92-1975(-)
MAQHEPVLSHLEGLLRQQRRLLEEAVAKHRLISEDVMEMTKGSDGALSSQQAHVADVDTKRSSSSNGSALQATDSKASSTWRPWEPFKETRLGCFCVDPQGSSLEVPLVESLPSQQESLTQPLLEHRPPEPRSPLPNLAHAFPAVGSNSRVRIGHGEAAAANEPLTPGEIMISRFDKGGGLPMCNAKHIFPSHGAMNKRVQDALQKPQGEVEEKYCTTGIWQRIARHSYFQTTMFIIITLNTAWMAIDTDYNKADVLCDAPFWLQLGNNFFCASFFIEIIIRLMAFRKASTAFCDIWFVFDALLVLLMVWETWVQVALYLALHLNEKSAFSLRSATIFRLFRLFRLFRVARMSRLLRSVPELSILVKGMGVAMRSMLVTLSILILVIYIFAIMFTQLMSDSEPLGGPFSTVPNAMNFMLSQVLCGFDAEVLTRILKVGWPYYVLWLLFVLLASLTIMNMLIGILCDVVTATAESEKNIAVLRDIEQEVRKFDVNGSGCVSAAEFREVFEDALLIQKLNDLGVDVGAFADFAHFLLMDGTEIPLSDFIDMAAHFRGSDVATVKDIVELRRFVCMQMQGLLNHLDGGASTPRSLPGPLMGRVASNPSCSTSPKQKVGQMSRQGSPFQPE